MSEKVQHTSSFRDPSGHIFLEDGVVKRSVNPIYFKQYVALRDSGFYQKLIDQGWLVPHVESEVNDNEITLKPNQIPFITYPYEWSFSQYKEAALLTLKIQKFSLDHGFSLKDASAFNITFYQGKPIFIDTLSFDFYSEGSPWHAYKQFITHFLGPLVLAKYCGSKSLLLMEKFMDGIPLDMLVKMLPFKTKLNPFLYSNIHMLAKYEAKYNVKEETTNHKKSTISRKGLVNIITALFDYIKKLDLKEVSEWSNYYQNINYSDNAFNEKTSIISEWVNNLNAKTILDVGGNNGHFIRSIQGGFELALVGDIDQNAVGQSYIKSKQGKENYVLPFVLDILNPSSGIGFNNEERFSFLSRIIKFKPYITLALALIHHVSLSGNVGFGMAANFFARFSKYLIIEFPDRSDSWVERLLNTKGTFRSHFDWYEQSIFENEFQKYFELVDKKRIPDSDRTLYLMLNKNN